MELIIDGTCQYIDEYFANKNICGFKEGKCYIQQRKCNSCVNGCCRKCIYQSEVGCKTKNVACKLFFCSEVKRRYSIIEFQDIKLLKCLGFRQRCLIKHDYFSSKEEVVNDLYFNSLIIGVIRMFIRLLINLLNLKTRTL